MAVSHESHDSAKSYGHLLEAGIFSDYMVECGDHEWAVHRVILCGQSRYFQRALEGEFKEANQDYVSLKDDEPALLARLLIYLYTGDIRRTNLQDDDNILAKGQFVSLEDPYTACDLFHEVKLYVKMYTLADKYLLVGLKELVRGYYCETLMKYTDEVESSKEHVSDTIFRSDLISMVYNAVPGEDRDLRDPLLVLIQINLNETKTFDPDAYNGMALGCPEFNQDLRMQPVRSYGYICEKCHENKVFVLDGYCKCRQSGCDKWQCQSETEKNLQCRVCGYQGFIYGACLTDTEI